jgi:hypothetical protein
MKTQTIKLTGVKNGNVVPFDLKTYRANPAAYTLQTRRGIPAEFVRTLDRLNQNVVCVVKYDNGEDVEQYEWNGVYNTNEQNGTALDLFMVEKSKPEVYYYVAGKGLLPEGVVTTDLRTQSKQLIVEFE